MELAEIGGNSVWRTYFSCCG